LARKEGRKNILVNQTKFWIHLCHCRKKKLSSVLETLADVMYLINLQIMWILILLDFMYFLNKWLKVPENRQPDKSSDKIRKQSKKLIKCAQKTEMRLSFIFSQRRAIVKRPFARRYDHFSFYFIFLKDFSKRKKKLYINI